MFKAGRRKFMCKESEAIKKITFSQYSINYI